MKKHNLMKFMAVAFTALTAPLAALAGDIIEIVPMAGSCEPSSALKSGQKLQFIMRLLARDYEESTPSEWGRYFVGAGSEEIGKLYLPRVGIVVSGQLRYAEIISMGKNAEKGSTFTDLLCEYTVQPGDFALPVKLALKGSTENAPLIPDIDVAGSAGGYFIQNVKGIDPASELWQIRDANGSICDFTWCSPDTVSKVRSRMPGGARTPTTDVDLSKASFYVKSIDFDDKQDTDEYWRVVQEGKEKTTYKPTITTIGTSSTNEAPTSSIHLYVWAEDEEAVEMTGANVKPYTMDLPPLGTKTGTRKVYEFDLVTGVTEYPIRIKGKGRGKATNLILSATPNYVYNYSKTALVTNFLTRTVFCKEPDKPEVTISFDGAGEDFLTRSAATNSVKDVYKTDSVPLYISLDEPFGERVTLTLKAEITNDEKGTDVFANNYIGVDNQNRRFTALPLKNTTLEFEADETLKSFFAYPMGGDEATSDKGIRFTIEFAPGTSESVKDRFRCDSYCTLVINDAQPTVLAPTPDTLLTGSVKDGCTINVEVNDCYRDLNPPQGCTVEVTFSDGAVYTTNNVAFRAGKATPIKASGFGSMAAWARVKVTDPQGNFAVSANIPMTVPAAKTVTAELLDSASKTSPAIDDMTFAEGQKKYLRFRLGPNASATSLTDMYAFLVPLNEASSNLVVTTATTEGVLIPGNSEVSSPSLYTAMEFLDGSSKTANLMFDIVLRNGPTAEATELRSYAAQRLYLAVTNMAPTVTEARFNGGVVSNGGRALTRAPAGAAVSFEADIADVAEIDCTNDAQRVIVRWTIRDGEPGFYSFQTYYTTNSAFSKTVSAIHKFIAPGQVQTVSIRARDKDMSPTEWGPEYTFNVEVADAPYVILTDGDGRDLAENTLYFNEQNNGTKAFVNVKLSSSPQGVYSTDPLIVQLIPAKLGDGNLRFEKTELQFDSSNWSKSQKVYLRDLDGAQDSTFTLTARIKPDGKKNQYGDLWSDYYAPGVGEAVVQNVPPVIKGLSGASTSITNSASLGTPKQLSVTVGDTSIDLSKSAFRIVWMDPAGGEHVATASEKTYAVSGVTTNSITAKWEFTPNVEGYSRVSVTADDGDGGSDSWDVWFFVAPTKRLEVGAFGPASPASMVSKYGTAPGLGKGRVWADADRFTVTAFRHTYYCDVKSAQLGVYAYGYPAATSADGYADNGSLRDSYGTTGQDIALSREGKNNGKAISSYYMYGSLATRSFEDEWKYDNFFYCWADGSEEPCISERFNGQPKPALKANAEAYVAVTLDPYEQDKESYIVRNLEAVFSREKYVEDNMGDINDDGIPDAYVGLYKFDVLDAAGLLTGDDIKALNAYNDDEDYMPNTETSRYGAIIPGEASTWATVGSPFTALLEIRGYGQHLNNAPALAKLNDFKPDVSADTFSDLERLAWMDAGAPKTNDGKPDLSKWSPERPTNPTLPDTDGDGLTDGYEYYFWYRAHVGYMENEEHKYMTGRRYDPVDPMKEHVITSAEIEKIFDPLSANGDASDLQTRDSDNDGLPDLLEFELGTNPIDWDTDGDGLPDGYEVTFTGTDPLKYSTNGAVSDGDLNLDGDYMALTVIETPLFALDDGKGGVDYYRCESQPNNITVEAEPFSTKATILKYISKDGKTTNTYVTVINPVKTRDADDGTGEKVLITRLPSTDTWMLDVVTDEGGNARNVAGMPVTLEVGTRLTEVSAADQSVYNRKMTFQNNVFRFWKVWTYGRDLSDAGKLVQGKEFNHSTLEGNIATRAVRMVSAPDKPAKVHLIHYHVYQELDHGYDPRTAWKGGNAVRNSSYCNIDELYLMTFFLQDGVLDQNAVKPTRAMPWETIWAKYTTAPGNFTEGDTGAAADTDSDGMPDGWELYLMAGPKVYQEDPQSENYLERICNYGPTSVYSPLYDFNKIADPLVRDNDNDGLEWPAEYSGSESGAQYPECETITVLTPEWRNKKMPTDPWNEDTDGDGLNDGEEGKHFIYGDPEADGVAGGGLNPLSWDTDGDNLPDPWEAEFAGEYVEGEGTNTTSTTTSEDGTTTNTVSTVTRGEGNWKGGMNGTVEDAYLDYDGDGLDNWQEYMVGAMRCWRYDDTVSPWGTLNPALPGSVPAEGTDAWNEFWYNLLVWEQTDAYNPHNVGGYYDNGASWFSQCMNDWDPVKGRWYMFKDGVNHDLRLPPDRYILGKGLSKQVYNRFTYRVVAEIGVPMSFWIGQDDNIFLVYPLKYICCDPTQADTDCDGMDDYYELFHGMNPLLGCDAKEGVGQPRDVVFEAYGGANYPLPSWSACNNYWSLNGKDPRLPHEPRQKNRIGDVEMSSPSMMDFECYPWMNGEAGADPDGDNIRNQQESIMPGIQAASTYLHTDPTPLWMTDSGYENSLTCRYFRDCPTDPAMIGCGVDGFDYVENGVKKHFKFNDFPLLNYDAQNQRLYIGAYSLNFANVEDYFFSFEENEGYDSDHDYLSDFEEAQGKTKQASDPQDHDSPLRSQAMYFSGKNSFLQTPVPTKEDSKADTGNEQPFLYYTVECWAKAEDPTKEGLQTIVERAIQTKAANPADEQYTRKNFVLGLKNGRWYTRFDSAGTDLKQAVEITDGPTATTNWTHLAATYDGTKLRLYVNGTCKNNEKRTTIQPEHGVYAVTVTQSGELGSKLDYKMMSLIVGASAINYHGIVMDYCPRVNPFDRPTVFADYDSYYKGYVDEIRIWDGARSDADILADYEGKVRYTSDMALKNRQEVFDAWRADGSRSPLAKVQLPPELVYHFSFDHIPGAVRPSDVLKSPAGFTTSLNVTDARAIWSRPDGYTSPWWARTVANLHSTIYTDYAWVPWIANTVSHLPRFDGSTLDSFYWGENHAGAETAEQVGVERFAFPRHNEVYSKWTQMLYKDGSEPITTHTEYDRVKDDEDLNKVYGFTLRNRLCCGDDLLPMGDAYPKRISALEGGMWDGRGAADAWAQTGRDSDNNSLPDWWEAYARANYCQGLDPRAPLEWDTTINYNGSPMPAWQAYLRDLAGGMLPGGRKYWYYADTRDFDGDGMPDWWEELYGIQGNSLADAHADADGDGLSNNAEYLISEVFKFAKVDPDKTYTTEGVHDYFRKVGDLYLGEIFQDHDHMEDAYEDAFCEAWAASADELKDMGVNFNRYVFDAYKDGDSDGWSNYAELMAYINCTNIIETTTTVITNGAKVVTNVETTVYSSYTGLPQPTINLTLRYNGNRDITDQQVVVRAYTDDGAFKPDATYLLPTNSLSLRHFNKVTVPSTEEYLKEGYLVEGKTTFFVYVLGTINTGSDNGGSGSGESESADSYAYTPGMPFAVVRDVDVSWSTINLDVELTDTDPSFARLPLKYTLGTSDRELVWGGTDVQTNADFTGEIAESANSLLTRIRVIRCSVDDLKATKGSLLHRVVYDKYVPTASRTFLCEYDVIGSDEFDIDWANFSEVLNNGIVAGYSLPITQVTYRVCFGEGAFPINALTNAYDLPWVDVARRFERVRTIPVADPAMGVLHAARPTFRWTMPVTADAKGERNTRGVDTYTAFRVVVEDASTGAEVYNSGLQRRPVREMVNDSDLHYIWEAPVSVGSLTTSGVTFKPGNYRWKVSMYNSKFQTDAFSAYAYFSVATGLQNVMDDGGYGALDVAVRYAGPESVLANCADLKTMEGKVLVQAFETPDFTGTPASETVVTSSASLTSVEERAANAHLVGLPMGKVYYIRAFIDSNGNRKHDTWESWGYCKLRNCESAVQGVEVSGADVKLVALHIEDCDTDGDWLPDAWEYITDGYNVDKTDASVDPAGRIVFDAEAYLGLTNGTMSVSTKVNGASLTLFSNLEAASLLLGLGKNVTYSTLDAIRAAIEKHLADGSVKITAMAYDQMANKVSLTVDGKVEEPTGDPLAMSLYGSRASTSPTVSVEIKVFTKENLATDGWTQIVNTDPATKGADGSWKAEIGKDVQTVEIDLGDNAKCGSGYFRVEVRQL